MTLRFQTNRLLNLIILAVTFSRQSCRSVQENATPTGVSESSIVAETSFENQGTTLAQVSAAEAGNRNGMPQLDDSCPGASLHYHNECPIREISTTRTKFKR